MVRLTKDKDLPAVPAQAGKTKEQLINELVEPHQQIAELEELIKPKGRPNKDVKEGKWNRPLLFA